MPNVINATSTGNGGLITQGDDSGILNIQTNETTAITVDASQRAAFVAGTAALPAITTTGDTNTGIWFPAADTIAFTEGGAESMRIDSSGNLGIGTSSPSAKLDVLGKLLFSNPSGNTGLINNGVTTGDVRLFGGSSGTNGAGVILYGGSHAATPDTTLFMTGSTERMRIDSSGSLCIGSSGNFGARVNITFDPASTNGLLFAVSSGTFTNKYIYFQNSGGSQIGSVSSNNASVTYNTTSDYRIKTNIQPISGALAKVTQLKPVTYDWKPEFAEGSSQGFIAHELQAVVPDCVTGAKDAIDADGKPVYQGIDTSFLVATLTAAIQEQQALIVDLQARLAKAGL